MSLPRFLNLLLHEGRVRVDSIYDQQDRLLCASQDELDEAAVLLEEFELDYRRDLAHEPPPLSVASLLWAAENVQRACSLLTFRGVGAEGVRRALEEVCPETQTPSVVYSVDLTYRFLPDLMRLARAASPDDCLVHILKDWARQWPLSSVGITDIGSVSPPTFLDSDCLRQMYVDRILAEQDESRLDDPKTRDALAVAVGRHPHLAPKLAARLGT